MLLFTLAISYLSTFNLPSFLNLTLQVPMQYHSLQHWNLLSPETHPQTGINSIPSGAICLLFSRSMLDIYQPGAFIFQSFSMVSFCLFILFMAEQKDMCSSSPVRTLKLQLAAEEPLTGECWNPPKNKMKKIRHDQGQRGSHNKKIGGTQSCLKSNSYLPGTLGGHKQNLVCIGLREGSSDPHKRLSQTCLWVRVSYGVMS